MFNATFTNISVRLQRPLLLVEYLDKIQMMKQGFHVNPSTKRPKPRRPLHRQIQIQLPMSVTTMASLNRLYILDSFFHICFKHNFASPTFNGIPRYRNRIQILRCVLPFCCVCVRNPMPRFFVNRAGHQYKEVSRVWRMPCSKHLIQYINELQHVSGHCMFRDI